MLACKEVAHELHPVFPLERTTTLLLIVLPRAFVRGAVVEPEGALPLLFVILKLALVLAPIFPLHLSIAFSLAMDPVAYVESFARPNVLALLFIGN